MANIHSFFRCFLYGGGAWAGGPEMKKAAPLQEIMNQMAGRMDMLLDHHTPSHRKQSGVPQFDEVQRWIAVDPLLADLHKRYLDLRASHDRLLKRHGPKDPMTDIAADMAESAQCAVDTRLIEVRQNPVLCAAVSAMKAEAREELLRERMAQSRFFQNELQTSQRLTRATQMRKRAGDSFWMLFVMLILMRDMVDVTRHHLSIAMTFQNATRLPSSKAA